MDQCEHRVFSEVQDFKRLVEKIKGGVPSSK